MLYLAYLILSAYMLYPQPLRVACCPAQLACKPAPVRTIVVRIRHGPQGLL